MGNTFSKPLQPIPCEGTVFVGASGQAYYVKGLPLVDNPWDADVLSAITEADRPGEFKVVMDVPPWYPVIFRQMGSSPSPTDPMIATMKTERLLGWVVHLIPPVSSNNNAIQVVNGDVVIQ